MMAHDESASQVAVARASDIFTVLVEPEDIQPAIVLTLTFALSEAVDVSTLAGREIVLLDEEGQELAREPIAQDEYGSLVIEPVTIEAPQAPGLHKWQAMITPPDVDEEGDPLSENRIGIELVVGAHRPSVAFWDLSSVVERGAPIEFFVGLKCPLGCDSAGWAFAICDADGQQIASGNVGHEIWPGTTGVYYSKVTLPAPDEAGIVEWQIVAQARDEPFPHAEHRTALRIHVGETAAHRLRVMVIDAESREPVVGARVVAHPYRTTTDSSGIAELHLPPGAHRIFVSGKTYLPLRTDTEIVESVDLSVEMHVDHEFGIEEQYA